MRDASERDVIEAIGEVREQCRGFYIVACEGIAQPVRARLGGRLMQHRIKVLPGDRVRVEVSPYDTTRARITFRL
jgi:translation initiation factor IF-1